MKARFKLRQVGELCGLAWLALGLSLLPVTAANSTFTDANWCSLGDYPGVDGGVYATVVDDAGNLYIGGSFHIVGGVLADGIAKWDGTNWSALQSGSGAVFPFNIVAQVSALAVLNGEVYAGGVFTTAGKVAATNIAKWNGNSWLPLDSGVKGGVSALAVSGSDLFVGGGFTTAGGKVSGFMARAYLLDLPALSVNRSGSEMKVSWPSVNTADFTLEQSATLTPASWIKSSARVTDDGVKKSETLPATNAPQFFRLRRP